jgi:hypothetical protein
MADGRTPGAEPNNITHPTNTLKSDTQLNHEWNFSSYLAEKTAGLQYSDKPFNSVQEDKR